MRRSPSWMILPLSLAVCGMAVAVFKQPSPEACVAAAGEIFRLEPTLRRAFSSGGQFEKKKEPGPLDWLGSHPEPGQSFDQWLKLPPKLPDNKRSTLYILPIGRFEENAAPDIEKLRAYAAAYYHPMPVEILGHVMDRDVPAKQRNRGGIKQWKSTDILEWLPRKLPEDGYAMIAVTMTDLYPDEAWNFVFGQASLTDRVGVFSFARYHPAWHGEEVDKEAETLVLRRAAKVLTHEMGHMFGFRHCIFYECNMNGANHLEEADSTPMHLCPVCLRKLHKAAAFDPISRYRKLQELYEANRLTNEAQWVESRINSIRGRE